MRLATGKMPMYNGKGPNPATYVIGDHAPPKSPFRYMPWDPYRAVLLDPKWYYADWRSPYAAGEWTVTTVGAGSAVSKTTDNAMLFTTDTGASDLVQLQHLHTFTPAANAFAAYYARIQVSDENTSHNYFGASSADTSIVASEPANYAMFKKASGGTTLLGRSNDAGGTGSDTASLITTWAAATDYDIGVVLVPSSTTVGTMFFCYKLASASAWSQVVKTTDFPDALVRLTFLLQNGAGAAKTMTIKRWAYAAYAGG